MKRFLLSLLAVICFIGCVGLENTIKTTYTREVQVIGIDNNITIVEDESGHLWELETDELKQGQKVILIMNNNNTDGTVTDDAIIYYKIKK